MKKSMAKEKPWRHNIELQFNNGNTYCDPRILKMRPS